MQSTQIRISRFVFNDFSENTYLIHNETEAIVIDPGFSDQLEWQSFHEQLLALGVGVKAVLLTHSHIDHVLGLERLLQQYPVPVYQHKEDKQSMLAVSSYASNYGYPNFVPTVETMALIHEQELHFFGMTIKALFTPGHAPGHLAYYLPMLGVVIAGDALFRRSIGRTDLPGGDFDLLADSIKKHLYTLPADTVVLPGHGDSTKIEEEQQQNPYVRLTD